MNLRELENNFRNIVDFVESLMDDKKELQKELKAKDTIIFDLKEKIYDLGGRP